MYIKPVFPHATNSIISKQQNRSENKEFNTSFDTLLSSKKMGENQFDSLFMAAGKKWGVSPKILKAIAKAESNFNPDALSSAGAEGIMQLMPDTARSLGVKDSYNPEENIFAGARYIRSMLDRFNGDIKLALAAYNAGPGNVEKYQGIPPFSETQKYVTKIMGTLGSDIELPPPTANSIPDSPLENVSERTMENTIETSWDKNNLSPELITSWMEFILIQGILQEEEKS